jgi:hypothetical protein
LSNPEVRKKCEDTNIEKFGTQYAMQSKNISQKMSETILKLNQNDPLRQQIINNKKKITYNERLGVEHPSQSDTIKNKKENTNLKNRGVKYPAQSKDVLEKMQNTYEEKTGYKSVSTNPEVRKKAQNTLEKNYGVKYPTQNPELMHKAFVNSFRIKLFTFPSGRTTTYMGYENYAIEYLMNEEKIDENDIYTENLTQFTYNIPGESIDRKYTPDIYIKSQNRYIEVKSPYTITQDTDNIFRKQNAIKNLGIICEIWVINDKCILLEKYT